VIADEQNPDLFYLNEVYADAFNTHAKAAAGPPKMTETLDSDT
jgi:quinol monooxygenase YgiN